MRQNFSNGRAKLRVRTIRNSMVVAGSLVLALTLAGCSGSSKHNASPSGSAGTSGEYGLSVDSTLRDSLPSKYKTDGVSLAFYSDGPPDTYVENGKPAGWTIDMYKAISEVLGVKFKFVSSAFDPILLGVQNERFDVGLSSYFIKPARLKIYDLVPTLSYGETYAASEASGLNIQKYTDLCGHTAAVLADSSDVGFLAEISKSQCEANGKPAIVTKQFTQLSQAALAVGSGRVDILAMSEPTLAYYAKRIKGINVFKLTYHPVYVTAAVRKSDPLGPALAKATQILIDKGVYQKILNKWGITQGGLTKGLLATESNPDPK